MAIDRGEGGFNPPLFNKVENEKQFLWLKKNKDLLQKQYE